jgi:hypothetical protein
VKILGFDIEISNVFDLRPGEDINKYAPFDVAVAATQIDGGEHRIWYSPASDGKPSLNMDRGRAQELLDYLEQMQKAGHAVCAWNGLSFDLQWIARAADDAKTASRVARALYDPMFQFFKMKGFPVSLAAVAEGLGVPLKKSMAAEDAPREWQAGNHQRVFDYVLGDARMTNQIVEAILRRKQIAWITQRGQRRTEPLPQLKPVAECMLDPMPDQSWMAKPLGQEKFVKWLTA